MRWDMPLQTSDPDLIPVIDVTPLRDGSAPLSVAQKLHQASQQLGFIYITGHGIPDGLIDRLRTTAMDFFTADPAIRNCAGLWSPSRLDRQRRCKNG